MCIMHGFTVGLDNNGFTNPIISSCLVHTICFPLDFRFLLQFIVVMFAGLTACIIAIPPVLPPGNHAHVQNSWHLLKYNLFKTTATL